MNKIEAIKKELKQSIYYNKIDSSNLDKANIEKNLYILLRECIINQEYIIEIGSYTINITPKNLSVTYETENTKIEVSNEDIHSEATISSPVEYFVITDKNEESYPKTSGAIRVTGVYSIYDDTFEELYEFEINKQANDDIRKYINLDYGFMFVEDEENTKFNVIIKRKNNKNTKYLNMYELLKKDKVLPVYYNPLTNNYIPRDIKNKTYEDIIPQFEDQKLITSYLYGLIVKFYTDYMNSHN